MSHTITPGQTPDQALAALAAAIEARPGVDAVEVGGATLTISGAFGTALRVQPLAGSGFEISNPGQVTEVVLTFSDNAAAYPTALSRHETFLHDREITITIDGVAVTADIAYAPAADGGAVDVVATLSNLAGAIMARAELADVIGSAVADGLTLTLVGKSVPATDTDAPTFAVDGVAVSGVGVQQQTMVSFSTDPAAYYAGGQLRIDIAGEDPVEAAMVAGNPAASVQALHDALVAANPEAIEQARFFTERSFLPGNPQTLVFQTVVGGQTVRYEIAYDPAVANARPWQTNMLTGVTRYDFMSSQLTMTINGNPVALQQNTPGSFYIQNGKFVGLFAALRDPGGFAYDIEMAGISGLNNSQQLIALSPGGFLTIYKLNQSQSDAFLEAGRDQLPLTKVGIVVTASAEGPDPLNATGELDFPGEVQQATITLDALSAYGARSDGSDAGAREVPVYFEGGKVYATIEFVDRIDLDSTIGEQELRTSLVTGESLKQYLDRGGDPAELWVGDNNFRALNYQDFLDGASFAWSMALGGGAFTPADDMRVVLYEEGDTQVYLLLAVDGSSRHDDVLADFIADETGVELEALLALLDGSQDTITVETFASFEIGADGEAATLVDGARVDIAFSVLDGDNVVSLGYSFVYNPATGGAYSLVRTTDVPGAAELREVVTGNLAPHGATAEGFAAAIAAVLNAELAAAGISVGVGSSGAGLRTVTFDVSGAGGAVLRLDVAPYLEDGVEVTIEALMDRDGMAGTQQATENLVEAINAQTAVGGKLAGVIANATIDPVTGKIILTAAQPGKQTFEIIDVRMDYAGIEQIAKVDFGSFESFVGGKLALTVTPSDPALAPVVIEQAMGGASAAADLAALADKIRAEIEGSGDQIPAVAGSLDGIIGDVQIGPDGTITLFSADKVAQQFTISAATASTEGVAEVTTVSFTSSEFFPEGTDAGATAGTFSITVDGNTYTVSHAGTAEATFAALEAAIRDGQGAVPALAGDITLTRTGGSFTFTGPKGQDLGISAADSADAVRQVVTLNLSGVSDADLVPGIGRDVSITIAGQTFTSDEGTVAGVLAELKDKIDAAIGTNQGGIADLLATSGVVVSGSSLVITARFGAADPFTVSDLTRPDFDLVKSVYQQISVGFTGQYLDGLVTNPRVLTFELGQTTVTYDSTGAIDRDDVLTGMSNALQEAGLVATAVPDAETRTIVLTASVYGPDVLGSVSAGSDNIVRLLEGSTQITTSFFAEELRPGVAEYEGSSTVSSATTTVAGKDLQLGNALTVVPTTTAQAQTEDAVTLINPGDIGAAGFQGDAPQTGAVTGGIFNGTGVRQSHENPESQFVAVDGGFGGQDIAAVDPTLYGSDPGYFTEDGLRTTFLNGATDDGSAPGADGTLLYTGLPGRIAVDDGISIGAAPGPDTDLSGVVIASDDGFAPYDRDVTPADIVTLVALSTAADIVNNFQVGNDLITIEGALYDSTVNGKVQVIVAGEGVPFATLDLSLHEFALVTSEANATSLSSLTTAGLSDADAVAALLASVFVGVQAVPNAALNTTIFAITASDDDTVTAIWAHRQSSEADHTIDAGELYHLATLNTVGGEFLAGNFGLSPDVLHHSGVLT